MTADQILDNSIVISLYKRPERLHSFNNRFLAAADGRLTRVQLGFDGNKLSIPSQWQTSAGAFGACLAHVSALARALSDWDLKTDDPICVFEDDAVFCDRFLEKLKQVVALVPPSWDLFYLGGEHLSGRPKPRIVAEAGDVALVRGVNVNRLHAYVVRYPAAQKVYLRLLRYLTNAPKNFGPSGDETCFDYEVGRMQEEGELVAYAAKPFLVGQGGFGSDTYPNADANSRVERYWNF